MYIYNIIYICVCGCVCVIGGSDGRHATLNTTDRRTWLTWLTWLTGPLTDAIIWGNKTRQLALTDSINKYTHTPPPKKTVAVAEATHQGMGRRRLLPGPVTDPKTPTIWMYMFMDVCVCVEICMHYLGRATNERHAHTLTPSSSSSHATKKQESYNFYNPNRQMCALLKAVHAQGRAIALQVRVWTLIYLYIHASAAPWVHPPTHSPTHQHTIKESAHPLTRSTHTIK